MAEIGPKIEASDTIQRMMEEIDRKADTIKERLEKNIPEFGELTFKYYPFDCGGDPLSLDWRDGPAIAWRWKNGDDELGDYLWCAGSELGIGEAAEVIDLLFWEAMAAIEAYKEHNRG